MDRFVVRLSPADAERMASWIGVDAMAFAGVRVAVFEESSTEGHRVRVGFERIRHVEVKVDLLRFAVWPIRRNVVRGELYPDAPPALRVENGVPPLISEHPPTEHSGPERALRREVTSVEHDYLTHEFQSSILAKDHSTWTRSVSTVMSGRNAIAAARWHCRTG